MTHLECQRQRQEQSFLATVQTEMTEFSDVIVVDRIYYMCFIVKSFYLYDTIEEFNVDSKAGYSALSSTHSQEKETKTNKCQCPFNSVQVNKIREGSP